MIGKGFFIYATQNATQNIGKREFMPFLSKVQKVTNLFFIFINIRVTFEPIGGTIIKITNFISERRAMIFNYEI